MSRLTLPMADAPHYHIALGDTEATPETLPGLRRIPLARPEATVAAVRYVQLPLWKEMAVRASQVTLSIGTADLIATLGDESFAAAAYSLFVEHIEYIRQELMELCEPGVLISVVPITRFGTWEWQERFNAALIRVRSG